MEVTSGPKRHHSENAGTHGDHSTNIKSHGSARANQHHLHIAVLGGTRALTPTFTGELSIVASRMHSVQDEANKTSEGPTMGLSAHVSKITPIFPRCACACVRARVRAYIYVCRCKHIHMHLCVCLRARIRT